MATGRHLAELCREEYGEWGRVALWVMAEVALVAADIQEVIGSAIALRILSHGVLPIWAGVVITAMDWSVFLSSAIWVPHSFTSTKTNKIEKIYFFILVS